MSKRIIIVSNRLPISVSREEGELAIQRSNGGLATALSAVIDEYDSMWVGWSGLGETLWPWQTHKLGIDHRWALVNLPAKFLHRYYERMANGVLWPRLHGMPAPIRHDLEDWKAYKTVNRKFAHAVKHKARRGDIIWIHDYHLLLVPGMLRKMGVKNRIGFFLHTPFATAECLSKLPQGNEILASLAQANTLGFQTKRDVSCFKAALENADIHMPKRAIVQDFPIGVDANIYKSTGGLAQVQQIRKKAKLLAAGRKIVLSVSRLDYTKGILEQLAAVEQFLEANSKPQILYKLVVAPSRETVAGYGELKQQITKTVQRINRRFSANGQKPVEFTYRNCGFAELSGWYHAADTLLVTPYIDGMNLVAKEYIAARQQKFGTLIISKHMGAAQQLVEAFQVDPRDVGQIVDALQKALNMPTHERKHRWLRLHRNVKTQDVFWWFRGFINTLQQSTYKE